MREITENISLLIKIHIKRANNLLKGTKTRHKI